MALENENAEVGHLDLSIFRDEYLWVNWYDIDDKKVPVPEIGGHYYRRDELPPLKEGKRGGVGLVLDTTDDGRTVCGVDLDGCLVDDVMARWAEEIIEELGTYTEVSPSGTGVKAFFIVKVGTKLPRMFRKQVQWKHKHSTQKKLWGIECYLGGGGRFFAVTEKRYRHFGIVRELGVKKIRFINERMRAFDAVAQQEMEVIKAFKMIPNDDLPWEDWNKLGMAIFNATLGSPAGRDAWFEFSRKSLKATDKETAERWAHWRSSPGDFVHAKQIFQWASKFGYVAEDDIADEYGCRQQVEAMNKGWAQIRRGKKSFIMEDKARDEVLYSILEEPHWRKLMKGRYPKFGSKDMPLYDIWLESRYRRVYAGVGLYPPGGKECPPEVFNLWRGWGIEPKQGLWERIKHHIKHILCSNDQAKYDYLFKLLAFRIQNPGKKAGVCIVLRGDEGIGKTVLVEIMRKIFGAHIFSTAQKSQVTGRFNSHMEHLLWFVTEEATWAGDKEAEGVLKDLITGTRMPVEGKFADVYVGHNLMDHIRITNHDWAVPAGPHARRYFMLDVSEEERGNRQYFGPLYEEIEGEGPAAMMWDLKSVDLSGFDYRTVPRTAELMVQKRLSMKSHEQYFLERVEAGKLIGMSADRYVDKSLVMGDYEMYCADHKLGRPTSLVAVGMFLGKVGVEKPANKNDRRWIFPDLVVLRAKLDRYFDQPFEWDDKEWWAAEGS